MRVDVFTLFPEYLSGALTTSILGRAREQQLLDVRLHDPREFTHDRHRSVDDAPFGGGAGMVMMPGPLFDCVEAADPPTAPPPGGSGAAAGGVPGAGAPARA